MSISKMFESLDDKVFTADLKESLEIQFNEAVELKVQELVEAKTLALEEKAEEYAEMKVGMIEEKAEEFVEKKMQELSESVERYLDRIIEDFINESKEKLEESIKSEQSEMIIEAFDSLLVATGVELSKIVEAKEENDEKSKLEESIKKYDNLIEENISLKEENDKLVKLGIINEMKEGLSLLESEKFERAASIVEFSRDNSYVNKLEIIKESILGTVEPKKEEKEVIVESVKESKIEIKNDFSHLI